MKRREKEPLYPHTATIRRTVEVTREGERTTLEYELSHVRLNTTKGNATGKAGKQASDTGVLYVSTAAIKDITGGSESSDEDEGESEGESSAALVTDFTPHAGDEVVFQDRVWKVAAVKPVFTRAGNMHHWEATLE